MADVTSNDNDEIDPSGSAGPDAHGQAAMLLVESLIHGLISKSIISAQDALDIIGVASDVKVEIAAELGDSQKTMLRSLALLEAISASLAHDATGNGPPVRPVS